MYIACKNERVEPCIPELNAWAGRVVEGVEPVIMLNKSRPDHLPT